MTSISSVDRAFLFVGRQKWLMQCLTLLGGAVLFAAVSTWFGAIVIALGAASMLLTRFGTTWNEVSKTRRTIALPAVALGYAAIVLLIASTMALPMLIKEILSKR
jgi:predicted membrane channel-forming protein YqfA (hemolysin III family)